MHVGAFNQSQDSQELLAEFSQLYPVEILQAVLNGSLNNPSFNISSLLPSGLAYTDPEFFHNQAANVTSTLQVCFSCESAGISCSCRNISHVAITILHLGPKCRLGP